MQDDETWPIFTWRRMVWDSCKKVRYVMPNGLKIFELSWREPPKAPDRSHAISQMPWEARSGVLSPDSKERSMNTCFTKKNLKSIITSPRSFSTMAWVHPGLWRSPKLPGSSSTLVGDPHRLHSYVDVGTPRLSGGTACTNIDDVAVQKTKDLKNL